MSVMGNEAEKRVLEEDPAVKIKYFLLSHQVDIV